MRHRKMKTSITRRAVAALIIVQTNKKQNNNFLFLFKQGRASEGARSQTKQNYKQPPPLCFPEILHFSNSLIVGGRKCCGVLRRRS
jgi:hypothetical protein